ncbi:MAG: hypothetical protein KKF30_01335 [Proteobacteria bacterium]|nr:hypothetical protein [Pseudomonadota bacterium]MBU4470730.1 hypothetical protein [Pseudomonadota bacterium]MCG2751542.1 hypothetical protein [Desulfobacteraceae bacterium]
MSDLEFGLTMLGVGMGGAIAVLGLVVLVMRMLKKELPQSMNIKSHAGRIR